MNRPRNAIPDGVNISLRFHRVGFLTNECAGRLFVSKPMKANTESPKESAYDALKPGLTNPKKTAEQRRRQAESLAKVDSGAKGWAVELNPSEPPSASSQPAKLPMNASANGDPADTDSQAFSKKDESEIDKSGLSVDYDDECLPGMSKAEERPEEDGDAEASKPS